MIKPDLTNTKTLNEFYYRIYHAQAKTHGEEYVAHHKAIENCIDDNDVKVVKELGVCQGATLAKMLLCKPDVIHGYDIKANHYNPYKHLFENYAKENKINFNFYEMSSLSMSSISSCDMLHIDTLHSPTQLIKELRLHGSTVKKYIVFHDTSNYPGCNGMFKAIAEYITDWDQSWKIVDPYIQRVGYTVIQREKKLPYIDTQEV